MKTKQDYINLLEETANHFNLKNRAIDSQKQCLYALGCAIGRLIPDRQLCKELDYLTLNCPDITFKDQYDELFPPELKEYDWRFLLRLQSLHDKGDNWNDTGLSELGNVNKQEILSFIDSSY